MADENPPPPQPPTDGPGESKSNEGPGPEGTGEDGPKGEEAPQRTASSPNGDNKSVAKSVKPNRKKRFMRFIYDKRTGAFLGRRKLSWIKIIIFYIVFYLMLIAFFMMVLNFIMMNVNMFFSKKPRIDMHFEGPIFQLKLNYHPTVTFLPHPHDAKYETSLLWITDKIDKEGKPDWTPFVKDIKDFIQIDEKIYKTKVTCSEGKTPEKLNDHEYCDWEGDKVADWGDCTVENKFGYEKGKPCVLIRLNRLIDWKPNGTVKIRCGGNRGTDKDLIGSLSYFPKNREGGDGVIQPYYFPYLYRGDPDVKTYMIPYVFVQFNSLVPGAVVHVKCFNTNNVNEGDYNWVAAGSFQILYDTLHK